MARSNRSRNATPRWRPQARIAAGLGAGALMLGACGVAGGLASAATSGAPTGCAIRVTAPSTITLTPTIAGRRRTILLHLPEGYAAATKVPLVLNLPGSGETARQQELLTDMNATADADHFIVAYPQALIADGAGYDWNIPGVPLIGGKPVPAGAANDVAFLTDLPGYLEAHYCTDPARVYATGISGGGRMASQLACDASTIYAAVAPVDGLRRPTPCPNTRPVPVIAFHGTADPVDAFNGHGQPYWTYSVPQAETYWANQDRCTTKPTVSHPDPTVTLTTYTDCHAGAIVELYAIAGEGHEWPGGPKLPAVLTAFLGPQTTAISANTTMGAFFNTHPLP